MPNTLNLSNHDARIRYYELLLEGDPRAVGAYALPEGFRFVFYQEGDRDDWIDIEKSAGELSGDEQGIEVWNRYFAPRADELPGRMVFIENAAGQKVATASAWYDVTGRDASGASWLHWVAVRREEQGKRLSKPLIAHVFSLMCALGYTWAKIPTQTTTWVACKIYLDLGFRPIPQNAVNSRKGWEIVHRLTDHPALGDFGCAADEEILKA